MIINVLDCPYVNVYLTLLKKNVIFYSSYSVSSIIQVRLPLAS